MTPDSAIAIRPAETDDDLRRCAAVMLQLRPHLTESDFISQVRRQEDAGYRLVMLEHAGVVRAVAGYRIWETLFSGVHMYVDDLVTDESARSTGLGGRLFLWLERCARDAGSATLELDSGVHRKAAHRFYFRRGMTIDSFHFRLRLDEVNLK